MKNRPTRRCFLKRAALLPTTASILANGSWNQVALAAKSKIDRADLSGVRRPPDVQQTDILFDRSSYTAFPHVERLEGDELLIAFRQAPRQKRLRHTHPISIITVMRSYDLGETWETKDATQLAAGGGQEFAPIYLGQGHVGGLLAMHEVVPVVEAGRSGTPHLHEHEYPFSNVGGFWCWSDNYGLTWKLHHAVLFALGLQTCAAPIKLESGKLLAPCYGALAHDEPASNVLYHSDDYGKTWSGQTVITQGSKNTRGYYEPCLLELRRDHLLGMHRMGASQNQRDGLFWRNESIDGGKTWSEPVETDILSGACPRLLKLSDGRVLLTYGRRYPPYGIYARLSSDGGKTWGETSWLLREAPNGDQGYSSSLEIKPGRIFTTCYAQNAQAVTGITGTFWDLPQG